MKIKPFLIVIVFLALLVFVISKAPHKTPVDDSGAVNNGEQTDVTAGWKTFTDAKTGVSFKYPENFGTKYIVNQDWPPSINIIENTITCSDAGEEIARAGKTEQITVNGNVYCLTKVTEGAAGSIYTQYAYARGVFLNTAPNIKTMATTVILTFSLKAVQCANYDDEERKACEAERAVFDTSPTVDKIFGTMGY